MSKLTSIIIAAALVSVSGCTTPQQSPTKTVAPVAVVNVPLNVALLVKGGWDQAIGGRCEIADLSKISSDPIITPRILKELKITVKNAKGEIVGIGNLEEPKIVKDGSLRSCAFKSSANVSESPAYSVSIGKIEATFSLEEIKKGEVSLQTTNEELKGMIK